MRKMPALDLLLMVKKRRLGVESSDNQVEYGSIEVTPSNLN